MREYMWNKGWDTYPDAMDPALEKTERSYVEGWEAADFHRKNKWLSISTIRRLMRRFYLWLKN